MKKYSIKHKKKKNLRYIFLGTYFLKSLQSKGKLVKLLLQPCRIFQSERINHRRDANPFDATLDPRTSCIAIKSHVWSTNWFRAPSLLNKHKVSRVKYGANDMDKQHRPVISTIKGDDVWCPGWLHPRGWFAQAGEPLASYS